jgi:glycosidase
VQTWLPVNHNYKNGINVKSQLRNPDSLFNYYRHLLRVRRNTPALIEGEYLPLQTSASGYFSFLRTTESQAVLVILNYSDTALDLDFSLENGIEGHSLHLLFSSAVRSHADLHPQKLHVGAFEVLIAEVK